MKVKQLHIPQTNGTENEKSQPANPKRHEDGKNVYFTRKQKENADTTHLKYSVCQSLPTPIHSYKKVSNVAHVGNDMTWHSC